MKQPEDIYTRELPFDVPAAPVLYRVHMALEDGTVLIFNNMSKSKAVALYNTIGKNFNERQSSQLVVRYGWEEQK